MSFLEKIVGQMNPGRVSACKIWHDTIWCDEIWSEYNSLNVSLKGYNMMLIPCSIHNGIIPRLRCSTNCSWIDRVAVVLFMLTTSTTSDSKRGSENEIAAFLFKFYPLVNNHTSMENHHLQWVNQLSRLGHFQWLFWHNQMVIHLGLFSTLPHVPVICSFLHSKSYTDVRMASASHCSEASNICTSTSAHFVAYPLVI